MQPQAAPMLPVMDVRCPYCGEPLALVVDASAGDQAYVEDCAVCCRPMAVSVRVDGADIQVVVRRDDEG